MRFTVVFFFWSAAFANAAEVRNSSFDEMAPQTGHPVAWHGTCLPGKGRFIRYECDQLDGREGGRALKMSIRPDHPDEAVSYNVFQDLTGLEPGQRYRIAAKVRTLGVKNRPGVMLQCYGKQRKEMLAFAHTGAERLDKDITEWRTLEGYVTIPDGTDLARLRVGMSSVGNVGGTAWFDDVEVTKAD